MPSTEDYYKYVRQQIEHEDLLINNRMTWLIALQALLFTAYGFSLGAEVGPNVTPNALATIATARTGFALIGIVSSMVILIALYAAARSIDLLVKKWMFTIPPDEQDTFPQIVGNMNSKLIYRGQDRSLLWRSTLRRRASALFLGLVPVFALPIACISVWVFLEESRELVRALIFSLVPMAACWLVLLVGIYIGRKESTSPP